MYTHRHIHTQTCTHTDVYTHRRVHTHTNTLLTLSTSGARISICLPHKVSNRKGRRRRGGVENGGWEGSVRGEEGKGEGEGRRGRERERERGGGEGRGRGEEEQKDKGREGGEWGNWTSIAPAHTQRPYRNLRHTSLSVSPNRRMGSPLSLNLRTT